MLKRISLLTLFLITVISLTTFAQEVSIVLKNSKVVTGRVVEEKPEYILLTNDIGQIKLDRQSIESITYNPFIKLKAESRDANTKDTDASLNEEGHKFVLNDHVVAHLNNGNVVSGLLLAKSLNMIMLQTEVGNLTIPKKDLILLEYVSSEYAERGEVVVILLNNGTKFEGNIYFEDSDNLALDTEIGRLTIDKKKLRSIEYTGKTGLGETSLIEQYAQQVSMTSRTILPRYDVFELGYSADLTKDFGPGYGLAYESRFSLSQFEGFNLSAVSKFGLNYFVLNSDNIKNENPTIDVNAKGGALVTTFGAGAQLNIYPQTSSSFDFFVAPMLEGHFIYKTLDKQYPSFPDFNTKETTTDFKFGIGLKFGLEFLMDTFRIGVSYNTHFVFGDDGYNQFSIHFMKIIF